ncbi:MAG TPA: hypothetical protein VHL57_06650 [Flavobacteriales bacterium]|jgi:hypothetical protein|nr:hypothetical protein [Flavobacteriales bacterium]
MRTAIVLLFCCCCIAVNAQIGEHKDTRYDPPTWAMIDDSLGHELGLTNEQMKKVQEADEHYRANVKGGDASAMDKREKDLKAILLPSQLTQWKEIAAKRRSAK